MKHELKTDPYMLESDTDDFEIMLRRLVHATSHITDPKVILIRQKADDLLRRKGRSIPMRNENV